jgi:hypothetical protein
MAIEYRSTTQVETGHPSTTIIIAGEPEVVEQAAVELAATGDIPALRGITHPENSDHTRVVFASTVTRHLWVYDQIRNRADLILQRSPR